MRSERYFRPEFGWLASTSPLRQRCRISVCFFAPSANAATIVFLTAGTTQ
jgi:hypothetical protein